MELLWPIDGAPDGAIGQGDGIEQRTRRWANAGLVDVSLKELVALVEPS